MPGEKKIPGLAGCNGQRDASWRIQGWAGEMGKGMRLGASGK
jgi:hypothetical protein